MRMAVVKGGDTCSFSCSYVTEGAELYATGSSHAIKILYKILIILTLRRKIDLVMITIKIKNFDFKRLRNIIVMSAVCLISIVYVSQLYAEGCPSGMIAYWEMEEDATGEGFSGYPDKSGYANRGLCSGSCPAITSDTPEGAVNNGQNFNGSNTGIEIAANTVFDFGSSDSFSIELWFQRQSVSTREVLMGRYSHSSSMNWWVGIEPTGRVAFSLTSSSGESGLLRSRTQKVITNGVWHHVVAVRTNDQNRLYVDGKLEDSQDVIYNGDFASLQPLTIGYLDNDVPAYHFGGFMDEVTTYNTALTENEIRMHYYLSRGYCEVNDTPVKIMPLGDSITYDSRTGEDRPDAERTGYRWPLWLWLENASYWVDFVGSEKAGADIVPPFDGDNAGFPGIQISQLAVLLDTGVNQFPEPDVTVTSGPYLQSHPTDVALLHIGTNGLAADTTGMEKILNEIDEYSKHITVILARIISRIGGSPETTAFNIMVENMVINRINENGDKIIIVDMEDGAGIIYDLIANGGDMNDALHPDNVVDPFVVDSGYGKMADVWFASLQEILPQSSPPVIVSTPDTHINPGALYRYQIQSAGNPGPVVTVSEPSPAPANFNFDMENNLITWVPGVSSSDMDVMIEATNWVGTDIQRFTILVNDAPVINTIPDQTIEEGGSFAVIDLDVYVNDPEHPDAEIAWAYSGNNNLTINIADRKVSIIITDSNWYGSESITFRATDPGGLFAEDITVFEVRNINDTPLISDNVPITVKKNMPFSIGFDALTVVDPDNVYPDDFSIKTYGGGNYTVSENIITPSNGFVGEINVPVSVNDGMDESNIRNVSVSVNDNSNESESSASLCFIDTIRN
jgi:hypothetical protein